MKTSFMFLRSLAWTTGYYACFAWANSNLVGSNCWACGSSYSNWWVWGDQYSRYLDGFAGECSELF